MKSFADMTVKELRELLKPFGTPHLYQLKHAELVKVATSLHTRGLL